MWNDKALAIPCLAILAVAEFVYAYFAHTPPQTTTIIATAMAALVSGSSIVCWQEEQSGADRSQG